MPTVDGSSVDRRFDANVPFCASRIRDDDCASSLCTSRNPRRTTVAVRDATESAATIYDHELRA